MKVQLVKLKEGNILVNDEKVRECNWCLNPNYYVEIFGYDYRAVYTKEQILNCRRVVASDFHLELPSIDYSGLEEELGIIGVEKLAEEYLLSSVDRNQWGDELSFINGFQKAQSLNNKEFSLEDMKEAYSLGRLNNLIKDFNDFIYGLQQPKTFNVEIEMEKAPFENEDNPADMTYIKPKVVNNKIKILKLL